MQIFLAFGDFCCCGNKKLLAIMWWEMSDSLLGVKCRMGKFDFSMAQLRFYSNLNCRFQSQDNLVLLQHKARI